MAPVITGLKKASVALAFWWLLFCLFSSIWRRGREIWERVLNSTNPFFLSFYSSWLPLLRQCTKIVILRVHIIHAQIIKSLHCLSCQLFYAHSRKGVQLRPALFEFGRMTQTKKTFYTCYLEFVNDKQLKTHYGNVS